jgi:hypothetical protein
MTPFGFTVGYQIPLRDAIFCIYCMHTPEYIYCLIDKTIGNTVVGVLALTVSGSRAQDGMAATHALRLHTLHFLHILHMVSHARDEMDIGQPSVNPTSREFGVLNSAVCAASIVLLTRRSNGIDQHCKQSSNAFELGNRVEYGHHTGVHETTLGN